MLKLLFVLVTAAHGLAGDPPVLNPMRIAREPSYDTE